ncbi:MAG TPA: GNAT family protein [Anaerolineales bacterium]|nr:GNAT family protein [Anaerolineales bacterium]
MELKQFSQEHFSVLASWFPTETELIQWGGSKLRFPLDNSQMYAMLNETTESEPDKLCWMALHENCLVGHAQLHFDWKNGNAALARVAIAPAFRGQKLAGLMLNLVMAQAFKSPQVMRLELNVFSFNQSAIHVYKRLGFVEEGIRRSSVVVGYERWDSVIMSVLRSEYKLLHEKVMG